VVQEDDGRYTEIGIVSFGHVSGCELGFPAVFTRVTSYLDWIEQNTDIVIAWSQPSLQESPVTLSGLGRTQTLWLLDPSHLYKNQQLLRLDWAEHWHCDCLIPAVFTRIASYFDWIGQNTGIVIAWSQPSLQESTVTLIGLGRTQTLWLLDPSHLYKNQQLLWLDWAEHWHCDCLIPAVFTRINSYFDWIEQNTGIVFAWSQPSLQESPVTLTGLSRTLALWLLDPSCLYKNHQLLWLDWAEHWHCDCLIPAVFTIITSYFDWIEQNTGIVIAWSQPSLQESPVTLTGLSRTLTLWLLDPSRLYNNHQLLWLDWAEHWHCDCLIPAVFTRITSYFDCIEQNTGIVTSWLISIKT
jgi:phage baseplate assembly protein gpV